MKLQSFQKMLLEYGIIELESDDKVSRDEMLLVHTYSVILEGEVMELDSLNKWIEINLGPETGHYILKLQVFVMIVGTRYI
jgi:hypothetical protein